MTLLRPKIPFISLTAETSQLTRMNILPHDFFNIDSILVALQLLLVESVVRVKLHELV